MKLKWCFLPTVLMCWTNYVQSKAIFSNGHGKETGLFEVSGAVPPDIKGKPAIKIGVTASKQIEINETSTGTSVKPTEISGTPTEISGIPTEISLTPTEISGTPNEIRGTPTEISGTPTEISLTPTELSGTPTEISGTPKENRGTPTEIRGTPTEISSTPTKSSGTPTGINETAPTEVSSTSMENNEATTEIDKIPIESSETPPIETNEAAPTEINGKQPIEIRHTPPAEIILTPLSGAPTEISNIPPSENSEARPSEGTRTIGFSSGEEKVTMNNQFDESSEEVDNNIVLQLQNYLMNLDVNDVIPKINNLIEVAKETRRTPWPDLAKIPGCPGLLSLEEIKDINTFRIEAGKVYSIMKSLRRRQLHSNANRELWDQLMSVWLMEGDFVIEHIFLTQTDAKSCGRKGITVRFKIERAILQHMLGMLQHVIGKKGISKK